MPGGKFYYKRRGSWFDSEPRGNQPIRLIEHYPPAGGAQNRAMIPVLTLKEIPGERERALSPPSLRFSDPTDWGTSGAGTASYKSRPKAPFTLGDYKGFLVAKRRTPPSDGVLPAQPLSRPRVACLRQPAEPATLSGGLPIPPKR